MPFRALVFPTRPPQSVAERHLWQFWEHEVAANPAAHLIWQVRLKWHGAGPRRYLLVGAVGLVIILGVIAGLTISNALHPRVSAIMPASPVSTAQSSGNSAGGSGQTAATTATQTANVQTLLLCGGAVVVGIGALAIAASLDERQRRRRSTGRPH